MMRSTEEALRLGLIATEADKKRWRELRALYEWHSQAALEREQFDLAMAMAVQAQLCREALEAEEISKVQGSLFTVHG